MCCAFYCVNDNKEVNVTIPQTMCCILCHNNPILNVNPKTQARKRLITYSTTNGIDHLNHLNIFLKFEKKINFPLKEDEKQPSKKRPNVFSNSISNFLLQKNLLRKMMCSKNKFWKI